MIRPASRPTLRAASRSAPRRFAFRIPLRAASDYAGGASFRVPHSASLRVPHSASLRVPLASRSARFAFRRPRRFAFRRRRAWATPRRSPPAGPPAASSLPTAQRRGRHAQLKHAHTKLKYALAQLLNMRTHSRMHACYSCANAESRAGETRRLADLQELGRLQGGAAHQEAVWGEQPPRSVRTQGYESVNKHARMCDGRGSGLGACGASCGARG